METLLLLPLQLSTLQPLGACSPCRGGGELILHPQARGPGFDPPPARAGQGGAVPWGQPGQVGDSQGGMGGWEGRQWGGVI